MLADGESASASVPAVLSIVVGLFIALNCSVRGASSFTNPNRWQDHDHAQCSAAGLAVVSPGTLTFVTGKAGSAGTSTIVGGVLTFTMAAGNFTAGADLKFAIPGITNPTAAQGSCSTIAVVTTTAAGAFIGASNT